MKLELTVEQSGRLDSVITQNTEYTRSFIKKLFENGQIKLNGMLPRKSGQDVKENDKIEIEITEPITKIEKKDIPIEILYQDEDVAVINKPQGLTVHPAGTNYDNTLVNALMFNLDSLSGINGEIRPGIVHRLDKDTSGVMVVAKNDKAHLSLSNQIANRTVKKEYLAIVEGNLKNDSGTIETLIGRNTKDRKLMAVVNDGRVAITDYKVITRFAENCLVLFRIHTGRTHQIRVHCKHLGHPIVGDKAYGYKKQKFTLDGQLLHAYRLTFSHPTKNEEVSFVAPVPTYFKDVYDTLARKSGQNNMDDIFKLI